jgi:hypothetical protein
MTPWAVLPNLFGDMNTKGRRYISFQLNVAINTASCLIPAETFSARLMVALLGKEMAAALISSLCAPMKS